MGPLTSREAEIARLVARGRSYKSIGAALGISPETVRNHVKAAAAKLGDERVPPKLRLVLFVLNPAKAPPD